jgi:predicted kinase
MLWVVAGAPGAGKSTVAAALARRLDPPAAILDKDTVYGGFVAAALAAAGRPHGEREGPWYDKHIKTHEYAGLAATAKQIRGSGCPVILVAPFTSQIRSAALWDELVSSAGGPSAFLIWVRLEPSILHTRLTGRGSDRDGQKLSQFSEFVRAAKPTDPPMVPHLPIDNSIDGAEHLLASIDEIVSAARRNSVS